MKCKVVIILFGIVISSFLSANNIYAKSSTYSKKEVVTIVFKPLHRNEMVKYAYNTVKPNSDKFHKYMNTTEFANHFGRSNAEIISLKKYFEKYNVKSQIYRGNLVMSLKGTSSQLRRAIKYRISKKSQSREVKVKLPSILAHKTIAVIGFQPVHSLKDHSSVHYNSSSSRHLAFLNSMNSNQFSKKFGSKKFNNQYSLNVKQLTSTSKNSQRIGIISFEDFFAKDVKILWEKEGIQTSNRIQKHFVIGKSKSRKNLTNQLESTLDVGQAGAIDPEAKVDAYIAKSASAKGSDATLFFDAFANAISDDKDKQISTSFGVGNELSMGYYSSVSPQQYNDALNILFSQAAIQGISIFSASGDNGPYEISYPKENHGLPTSPLIVEVGGTTIKKSRTDSSNSQEVAWNNVKEIPKSKINDGLFQGSGGGFSLLNRTPRFQRDKISGINTFRAISLLKYKNGSMVLKKSKHVITGKHSGRNIPDISGIADPNTGYATYISFKKNGKVYHTWLVSGGTSYVAPQMAAANALLNGSLSESVGFWNPQIYSFSKFLNSPLNPLNSGSLQNNNLFYLGQPGKKYNQATGLGTVNFTNLYQCFKDE